MEYLSNIDWRELKHQQKYCNHGYDYRQSDSTCSRSTATCIYAMLSSGKSHLQVLRDNLKLRHRGYENGKSTVGQGFVRTVNEIIIKVLLYIYNWGLKG